MRHVEPPGSVPCFKAFSLPPSGSLSPFLFSLIRLARCGPRAFPRWPHASAVQRERSTSCGDQKSHPARQHPDHKLRRLSAEAVPGVAAPPPGRRKARSTRSLTPKRKRSRPLDRRRRRQRYEESPDQGPLHIVSPSSKLACFYFTPLARCLTGVDRWRTYQSINRCHPRREIGPERRGSARRKAR